MILALWAVAAGAAEPCAVAADVVQRLLVARDVAEEVATAWPGWVPTLIGVRYHTEEGHRLVVAREEAPSCEGLPLPARLRGRRRPPPERHIGLERRSGTFWLVVVEGREPLPLEDLAAGVVHNLVHVHQVREGAPLRRVLGRGGTAEAAWAMRLVPEVATDVRRQLELIRGLLAMPRPDASSLQALVAARQRHFASLREVDPDRAGEIGTMERLEGVAGWLALEVAADPEASRVLQEAGVPPERLSPSRWRDAALEVPDNYVHATGTGLALLLEHLRVPWKPDVLVTGFDEPLGVAVYAAAEP